MQRVQVRTRDAEPCADKVVVGVIIKPRGLKGECKCIVNGEIVYKFFDGVTTREQAERLRGKPIEIDRAELTLADDEVFTSDLVGFTVTDTSGKKLGVVKSIENYGASDIVDCGTFMFPYEDAFVTETNMTDKKIVVRGEML